MAGPLWALSAAEWRLLVITFVGGLGSIVAGACVIGGAIALARRDKHFDPGQWGLTTALALVGLVLALVMFRYFPPDDRVDRWLKQGTIAVFGFGVVFALLVWIGVAAGVK
jgi:hypothetical protein